MAIGAAGAEDSAFGVGDLGLGARMRGIGWLGDRANKPLTRNLSLLLALATRHSSPLLTAFTTPGGRSLRHRQDSRKVSHGQENVPVIKEPMPRPGDTINLCAMRCGGNAEPARRVRARAKARVHRTAKDRAMLARLRLASVRVAPAVHSTYY
jgi:hypothetical protein